MPVDKRFFVWCQENDINEGDRVEWDEHTGFSALAAGSGTVELIWFGMEESLKVRTGYGELVDLYPAEGIHKVRKVLAYLEPPT